MGYPFRVCAVNAAGSGAESCVAGPVTPQGSRYYVYTLFAGLTVETNVPLRAEDFVVEAA